jgi:hypothetical protein
LFFFSFSLLGVNGCIWYKRAAELFAPATRPSKCKAAYRAGTRYPSRPTGDQTNWQRERYTNIIMDHLQKREDPFRRGCDFLVLDLLCTGLLSACTSVPAPPVARFVLFSERSRTSEFRNLVQTWPASAGSFRSGLRRAACSYAGSLALSVVANKEI